LFLTPRKVWLHEVTLFWTCMKLHLHMGHMSLNWYVVWKVESQILWALYKHQQSEYYYCQLPPATFHRLV
jgi:hypothetical protein